MKINLARGAARQHHDFVEAPKSGEIITEFIFRFRDTRESSASIDGVPSAVQTLLNCLGSRVAQATLTWQQQGFTEVVASLVNRGCSTKDDLAIGGSLCCSKVAPQGRDGPGQDEIADQPEMRVKISVAIVANLVREGWSRNGTSG